jgi:hypothetical protein
MTSNLKLAYFISITLRFGTEEAKITAWEDMQKVKAEAAIEKLVVSLSRTPYFRMPLLVQLKAAIFSFSHNTKTLSAVLNNYQIHEQFYMGSSNRC